MAEQIAVGAADEDRFDRSRRTGWLDLEAIFRSKVLMVGAGALGNEVAKDLALSGFRKITVVDMDHVVGSNLNRCVLFTGEDARNAVAKAAAVARGIKALSPSSEPEAIGKRIEDLPEGFFGMFDLVLGCLDNVVARLHVNSHSYLAGRPYIDGGMQGFIGRVTVVRPPDGACLQCGTNRSHAKVAQLRFSCTGKDIVFFEPRQAAEITTTSVVSAIMVREGLKLISGKPDMVLSNAFYYDGQRNVSEEIEIPRDPDCPVHSPM